MIVLDLPIWQIMCLFHQIIWLGFALYIFRIIITLHVVSENLCSIDKFLILFMLLLKDYFCFDLYSSLFYLVCT